MTTAHWGEMYSKHREFDAGRVQHFAGLFEQLAIDQGGGANGYDAQRIADAWFLRDVGLGENQARNFYRAVCREMRNQYDVDDGPGHNNHSAGSMPYIVGHFMYESCKYQKGFELVSATAPCPLHTFVADHTNFVCCAIVLQPLCDASRRRLVRGNQLYVRHASLSPRSRDLPWWLWRQLLAAAPGLYDDRHQERAQHTRAGKRSDRARACQLHHTLAHV